MRDLFFFDSMITPKIITILYWLLLAGAVISGLTSIFSPYGSLIQGLMMIFFGCIGARIWCELMIVLFKINGNLQRLADKP
ncbi:DUF4282 domain-containing protein [Pseudomonas sp. Marseille-QA0892]